MTGRLRLVSSVAVLVLVNSHSVRLISNGAKGHSERLFVPAPKIKQSVVELAAGD